MYAALVHSWSFFPITIVAGLLMLRLGSIMELIESRRRSRWCASCHQLIIGGTCACSGDR